MLHHTVFTYGADGGFPAISCAAASVREFCAMTALTTFNHIPSESDLKDLKSMYERNYPDEHKFRTIRSSPNTLIEDMLKHYARGGVIFMGDMLGGVFDTRIFPKISREEFTIRVPVGFGKNEIIKCRTELSETYRNSNTNRECRHMCIYMKQMGEYENDD